MMSFAAASSSSSATARVEKAAVRVEKATSHLLIGPDWTMNMDICDTVNNDQWQAKDVLKAVKKRLQNKNPKVQFLALTLLETMVKNCGDYVHFQLAERNILGEMIKIVRKKADMQVRDKILVLLDSWQEAFGGPSGKYPQYYWAYTELKRSGVHFPQRSANTPPIFTPPVAHSALSSRDAQSGYGVPGANAVRLEGNLSLSDLSGIRDVMELLREMLQAVNPNDRGAVKDELIIELVNQCRSNQTRLMQLIGSTEDEKLLGRGLELNDGLQSLLNKHDAIASGTHVPDASKSLPQVKPIEPPVISSTRFEDEAENDEDGFAQLAQRNSKFKQVASGSTSVNSSDTLSPNQSASSSSVSNALVPLDPPPPARIEQQRDMIDLGIVLSSTYPSTQNDSTPARLGSHSRPSNPPFNQGYAAAAPYGSYVAPWAQQQVSPPYAPPQLSYSPRAVSSSYQASLQHYNSFGANATSTAPSKPYVLPSRLFEDLIDFRSSSSGQKISTRSPLSDASSRQPMIGGKK